MPFLGRLSRLPLSTLGLSTVLSDVADYFVAAVSWLVGCVKRVSVVLSIALFFGVEFSFLGENAFSPKLKQVFFSARG